MEKTLYNGVSGFTPPIREQQWDWLWQEFPSPATIEHLRHEGVELLIVHYDVYEKMTTEKYHYQNQISKTAAEIQTQLLSLGLQEISCQDQICLYSLVGYDITK